MSDGGIPGRGLIRREFLKLAVRASLGVVLAACGVPPVPATAAPTKAIPTGVLGQGKPPGGDPVTEGNNGVESAVQRTLREATQILNDYVTSSAENPRVAQSFFDGATMVVGAHYINQGGNGADYCEGQNYTVGGKPMEAVTVRSGDILRIYYRTGNKKVQFTELKKSRNDVVGFTANKLAFTRDANGSLQMTDDGVVFSDISASAPQGEKIVSGAQTDNSALLTGTLKIDGTSIGVTQKGEPEVAMGGALAVFYDQPDQQLQPDQRLYLSSVKAAGLPPLLPGMPANLGVFTDKHSLVLAGEKNMVSAIDEHGKTYAAVDWDDKAKSWGEWEKVPEKKEPQTLAEWARRKGVHIPVLVAWGSITGNFLYKELTKQVATQATFTNEARNDRIFKEYDPKTNRGVDWRDVLKNWAQIKKDLDANIIPSYFNEKNRLDPDGWIGRVRELKAECEKMGIEFIGYGPIIGGGDILPPALLNGNFSPEETLQILECVTKVKALAFKDITENWLLGEFVGNSTLLGWAGEPSSEFWYKNIAGKGNRVTQEIVEKVVFNVANWLKQAIPNGRFALYEDNAAIPSVDPVYKRIYDAFMLTLSHAKEQGIPINEVGHELNLWILSPPILDETRKAHQDVQAMGYGIAPAQTTISVSKTYPLWKKRPVGVNNPEGVLANAEQEQAKLWVAFLAMYQQLGARLGIYGLFPENKDTFPENKDPTANAHLFKKDGSQNQAVIYIIKYLKTLPDNPSITS